MIIIFSHHQGRPADLELEGDFDYLTLQQTPIPKSRHRQQRLSPLDRRQEAGSDQRQEVM
jgi:hypothetical protein